MKWPDAVKHKDLFRRAATAGKPGMPPRDWKPLPALGPEAPINLITDVDTTRLKFAIECASNDAELERGIRSLDTLWQFIDSLVDLAESRMRILLTRIPKSKASTLAEPAWVATAKSNLLAKASKSDPVSSSALESAARLVATFAATYPDQRAELELGPNGGILVRWQNMPLRWLVAAPRLPWPGVSVRMYVRPDPESAKMDVETSHYAPKVIEHAAKNVSSN